MGFYIDNKELSEGLKKYQKLSKQAKESLDKNKKDLNHIISTNSLQGEVKGTINNEINNVINAINVGIKDCYELLDAEYQQTYNDLKDSIGEKRDDAVIDEDVLNEGKKKIQKLSTTHQTIRKNISKEYTQISDLIELKLPSNKFKSSCEKTNNYLQKIIDNVNDFNDKAQESSVDGLITAIDSYLNLTLQAGQLSYTDPNFNQFVSDPNFAKSIKDVDNQIEQAKKEAKKQREKELKKQKEEYAKHHPILSLMKDAKNMMSNWWKGVVNNTKAMHIPIIRNSTLFIEGICGTAASMIGDLVIGISSIGSKVLNYVHYGVNNTFGNSTEKWRLKEIEQTNRQLKGIVEYAVGLSSFAMPMQMINPTYRKYAEKAVKQTFQLGQGLIKASASYFKDAINAFNTGDYYAIGEKTFDIGSLFIGAGEVKEIMAGVKVLKVAEIAEDVQKGSKILTSIEKGYFIGRKSTAEFVQSLSKTLKNYTKYADESISLKAAKLKAQFDNFAANFNRMFIPELSFAGAVDGTAVNNMFINRMIYNRSNPRTGRMPEGAEPGMKIHNDHFDNKKIKADYDQNATMNWEHFETSTPAPKMKLKKNITYQTEGGHVYKTDELGRISESSVDELKLYNNKDTKRSNRHQQLAGGADRLLGDDGGHLFAKKFGGSPYLDNLVPQSKNINRPGGKWYQMETDWEKALKKGKSVSDVKIKIEYPENCQRPSKFVVKYKVDGVLKTKTVENI